MKTIELHFCKKVWKKAQDVRTRELLDHMKRMYCVFPGDQIILERVYNSIERKYLPREDIK